MAASLARQVEFYESAKAAIVRAGYGDEIKWQSSRTISDLSSNEFLCEAAWVIINSGFRESVARRLFPTLTLCFCEWSAREIIEAESACLAAGMAVFRHRQKLEAVVRIAKEIESLGWDRLLSEIAINPIARLMLLPFIGPITAFHLAKNVGVPVAKADRHLVRTARSLGALGVHELCHGIAKATGDPIAVVDLVLWRNAVQIRKYAQ
jgi:hypothetical protein